MGNMFRSNECLSCKYERSQKKVRFEEVIENIKKTKRIDILQPKIRKLEATAKGLRLEKKRLHKEIDILNKIRQSKTRIFIKKNEDGKKRIEWDILDNQDNQKKSIKTINKMKSFVSYCFQEEALDIYYLSVDNNAFIASLI